MLITFSHNDLITCTYTSFFRLNFLVGSNLIRNNNKLKHHENFREREMITHFRNIFVPFSLLSYREKKSEWRSIFLSKHQHCSRVSTKTLTVALMEINCCLQKFSLPGKILCSNLTLVKLKHTIFLYFES